MFCKVIRTAQYRKTLCRTDVHRDHVLRNAVAEANSSIEALRDDINQPSLSDDIQLHLWITSHIFQQQRHNLLCSAGRGVHLLAGGPGLPDGVENGWFVKPTVFSRVTNQMTIAREEIFGPVLSIITYTDEQQALAIANDTPYGLQAYILSSNPERAYTLANQIDAGRVLINTLAHEPRAPFGGFKQSGIGREYGTFGLEAFLEPKSILA